MPNPLQDSLLHKHTHYPTSYTPELLHPIPRQDSRDNFNIDPLPFTGMDYWGCLEFSFLRGNKPPFNGELSLFIPWNSPCIVESKSLKLYLNSFNLTSFSSQEEVEACLHKDLSSCIGIPISLTLTPSHKTVAGTGFKGSCLDTLIPITSDSSISKNLLSISSTQETISYYTDLFRSLCPVTKQPDWASIGISYTGSAIQPEGLLSYLLSFRNQPDFHEHCIEQITLDIITQCSPSKLSVYGTFNRRGGIFINPFRTTHETSPSLWKHHRQ